MIHQKIAPTTLEFATLFSQEDVEAVILVASAQTSCRRPKEETRPKEQRAMKVVLLPKKIAETLLDH